MTFNEIMQKAGKRLLTSIYYNNDDLVLIGQDKIKRARPYFNSKLIGTIMEGFEVETTEILPFNVGIYFQVVASYGSNSATHVYGPYYLKEEPTYNADVKTYTHNLYDEFLNTMVDYHPINITYPTTVIDYFKQLCIECGFTTNITTLPNGQRQMEKDIYEGINFTYRDVFDDIGGATASLFKVVNKEIQKCILGTETIVLDDDILKNQNIALGKHFGPINSIVLSRSADSDSVYKRDESLTKWNEFKISDNQLMNDNNRSDFLEELYDALYSIEYDIFDLELVGYGGFNPLQKIIIKTDSNGTEKTYTSYVFNNEQIYTQGFAETIYTEEPAESTTDYKCASKTDRERDIANLIVDKALKEIRAEIKTVSDSQKTLEEIMDMFSVDLETYTFSISTDSNKKPLETKDFSIKFFSYFKGQQVSAAANTADTCEGIDISFTDEEIVLSVSADKKIINLNNEITVNFVYEDENEEVYTLSKKLIVSLSLQGQTGAAGKDGNDGAQGEPGKDGSNGSDGKSAYQIWLDAGNTGTEADYLKSLKGEKGETGEQGPEGPQGPQGEQGIQGVPGVAGTNGTSTYFYVKFSANSNGNPMTDSPTSTTEYMGVASTTSSTAPTSYTGYKWSKIKGEKGNDGTPGTPGANGLNTYLHIMYSADGSTFVPEELDAEGNVIYELGKKPSAWIGQYADNTEDDSTNFDDYTWYKFTEDIDPKLEEMEADIAGAKTDINNNYQDLNNKINNCATAESVVTVSQKVEQILTDNSLTLEIIKDIQFNGVSQVKTKKGYIFNDDGLLIKDSSSPVENLVNQNGIDITNVQNDTTVLFAGYVDANNTKYAAYKGQTLLGADHAVVNTISVGNYSRFGDYVDEDGNCGTGPFEQ